VAEYAIPAYIEFRDALPKTGTHRIQYAALKAEGITPATWERPLEKRR
jgi:acyl-coenzyme A synthetase/AMP-(fatty) acid ligase